MHPDEFFDEHPEWFALVDGRLYFANGSHLYSYGLPER